MALSGYSSNQTGPAVYNAESILTHHKIESLWSLKETLEKCVHPITPKLCRLDFFHMGNRNGLQRRGAVSCTLSLVSPIRIGRLEAAAENASHTFTDPEIKLPSWTMACKAPCYMPLKPRWPASLSPFLKLCPLWSHCSGCLPPWSSPQLKLRHPFMKERRKQVEEGREKGPEGKSGGEGGKREEVRERKGRGREEGTGEAFPGHPVFSLGIALLESTVFELLFLCFHAGS